MRSKFVGILMALLLLPVMAHAQQITIESVKLGGEKSTREAWLVESHNVPAITVQMAFRGAGVVSDAAGQEGRAQMAAALLSEGAGDLNALQFQQALEDHAIKLSFSVNKDALEVEMQTLSEHADKAFELLGLALSKPRLDADAVARVKAQQHAALRQMEEEPRYVASRLMETELLGAHPYAKPTLGTHAGIDAVTPDALRQFVRDAITAGNLQMAVVGDVSVAQLQGLVGKHLAALKPDFKPLVDVPELKLQALGQTKIERRSIPQTVVLFAGEGIARNDPDFYAAHVMNHLLGGSTLTSKLGDEIREKRGLAYYAYSSLSMQDHGAWFGGGFGTRNDQAPDALKVLAETIAAVEAGGVSEQELADAKGFIMGAFPLALADNEGIASTLMMMQRFGLGKAYITERNTLIGAVTLDDVKRVAKRLLQRNRFVVIGVGDPSKNLADYR